MQLSITLISGNLEPASLQRDVTIFWWW